MTFAYTAEQEEFKEVISRFFAENAGSEYLRKRIDAGTGSDSQLWQRQLWQGFHSLGLFEFFSDKESATLHDLGIVAYECGRALCPENLVDALLAGPYLISHLEKTAREKFISELGLSEKELYDGGVRGAVGVVGTGADKGVHLNYQEGVGGSAFVVLLQDSPGGGAGKLTAARISAEQGKRVGSIDLSSARLSIMIPPNELRYIESGKSGWLFDCWCALKARELAGIANRCVKMTAEYVSERRQFGVPVGAFQAVQQQLADAHVKAETADALSVFATWACQSSPDQFKLAAISALWYARTSAVEVVETAIQLHGGIGFTWEHDLHLYLRRARAVRAQTSCISGNNWAQTVLDLI
ncbi:MAG: hypothetical protein J5J00_17250 [Deltaproteobacteria bacterium]|nr:hypothetical protein [Deltaproteobacteria bacterium]